MTRSPSAGPRPRPAGGRPAVTPRVGRPVRARDDGGSRRLRDVLRCNVVDGRYPDGVLPGEGELMLIYGARRATVRDALAMLREEGVVERVQGVGTYAVRERYVAPISELHGTDGADDGLLALRIRPIVLDRRVVPAPDAAAERLGVASGDPVLCLDYVATIAGEPFAVATNYMAFPEADAVTDVPFDSDFYSLLDDSGLELGGSDWVLSAVNADAQIAALLEVAPGTAVMLGEEDIWDASGRIYDFAVCYFRTDRFVFSSTDWAIGGRGGTRPLARSPRVPRLDAS
ncbi:GntR family transcriptional regulator [Patulibacter sp. NPDC049589]|uniref:GntR family transcriptional regulator n=1 Tax=Patulibacter sp. NPDC049589 TaxID=3154731 RepID=UPI0034303F9A